MRTVAGANLRVMFGRRLTPARERAIIRRAYRNMVRVLLDMFWLLRDTRARVLTLAQIHERCAAAPGRWIVWTGGEPTLQLTAEIVAYFQARSYNQAIETNGNRPVPPGLDWVACSPKVAAGSKVEM